MAQEMVYANETAYVNEDNLACHFARLSFDMAK